MTKVQKIEFGSVFERLAPVLLVATIALSFAVGILWEKVKNLESGGVVTTNQAGTTADAGTALAAGKLTKDQGDKVPVLNDKDHIRGNKNADLVVIEYSDLECPFCKQFHPTMEQAKAEYGDKIAWVYRHYPLDMIHPRAKPAANAAECVANLKGNDAFWKFTDMVFNDQTKYLSDAGLKDAAVSLGISGNDFSSCFSANKYQSDIDAQYQGGVTAGITGTPGTFVINKKGDTWLVGGAVPYTSLKATLDEALK